MNISIATLFPDLYNEFLKTSIIGKSINSKLISVKLINIIKLFNSNDSNLKKRVDSPVVGHGSGMILGANIIQQVCDQDLLEGGEKPFTIFFSPHGKVIDQNNIKDLFKRIGNKNLLLFSGRYEGFDCRAESFYADEILSIGNYVLMGGDLPIMVFMEALLRLLPDVIGKKDSVENDSFQGPYVDHPSYSAPQSWKGMEIPEVLKSGNHSEIAKWKKIESMKRTASSHFNWWRKWNTKIEDRQEFKKFIPNHYCALLHNDVMMPDGRKGESSVTSIDIHDIARSSATYGIKKYFIVTRLESQEKLVNTFLNFWQEGNGLEYNENRAFALNSVFCFSEIEEVLNEIERIEGVKPICIVTSSRREISHDKMINYFDQEKIWAQKRPILFVFGTSHGISKEIMDFCDYKLIPIEGFEKFNFLSVRSAAAIIFDRWLGINQVY
jgi:tRNA (guanine37-N1)-methyltransferase